MARIRKTADLARQTMLEVLRKEKIYSLDTANSIAKLEHNSNTLFNSIENTNFSLVNEYSAELLFECINDIFGEVSAHKKVKSKHIDILNSQLESLLTMYDSVMNYPEDSIYCLEPSHPRVEALKSCIIKKQVTSPEKSKKLFEKTQKLVSIAPAVFSKSLDFETGKVNYGKLASQAVQFYVNKKNSLDIAKHFYSLATDEQIVGVWRAIDMLLSNEFTNFDFSKVKTNELIHIPRAEKCSVLQTETQSSFGPQFSLNCQDPSRDIQLRVVNKEPLHLDSPSKRTKSYDKVIFHIHGGGFIALSSASHQSFLSKWAKLLNVPIVSVDYRLAPEHPFPCGLDDVWQAYCWLVEQGHQILGRAPSQIIVSGESAGGNLALSMTLAAIQKGYRVPDGLLLGYPCTNLDSSRFSPSYFLTLNDVIVPHTALWTCLRSYVTDFSSFSSNPYINPLLIAQEDLAKFPPSRFFVGTMDPLYDDSLRVVEKLQQAKADVKMYEYENAMHGVFNFDNKGLVPEFRMLVNDSAGCIKQMLQSYK